MIPSFKPLKILRIVSVETSSAKRRVNEREQQQCLMLLPGLVCVLEDGIEDLSVRRESWKLSAAPLP